MDEVFGEIMGLGYGSNSVMLSLLRSAMDEAHENVQSKDGPIELLNARSKFYEMAMILVEGCSKLIEEKAEIPKTNREKMLSDLKESKDMVRRRLEDLRFSIGDRDIELVERIENEFKLRQKLESKEKELVSLRAKLALERTKSEELQSYGDREGDFCELKNSVDQQMLSIKQKLEDERTSLSSANDLFGDENFEENFRPEQNLVIEQMSSDIDCLESTLDLAFGRMQTIEIGPSEKQWRRKIEKETIFIAIKGFMSDLREHCKVNFYQKIGNDIHLCFSSEQWLGFIDEITSLQHELKAFTIDDGESQESYNSSNKLFRTSSEPLPDHIDQPNTDQDSESSTHVAKMKKYHESVIKQQHEDLNWMKIREIFRGREGSFGKKNKDPDNLDQRIKEAISKMENFVKWKEEVRCQEFFREKIEMPKMEKYEGEIKNLKQERDDLCMQTMLIEETYVTLLKGLSNEIHIIELEGLIKNDVCICAFREMLNEMNILLESERSDEKVESLLRENVFMIILRNAIKEIGAEIDGYKYESLIREDIYNFIVLEAVKNETILVTETKAIDYSPSEKSAHEEENLVQESDSSLKCYEKPEDLWQNDNLSFRKCDREQLLYRIKCSVSVPLVELESTIGNFKSLVYHKLERNALRLDELTRKTECLIPTIDSLRKEASLYKKAFKIRCHNLKLAETEVDLLGDQVEELVDLLEKIYLILNKNLTTSSCNFRISDIQELIKKKLGRPRQ